MPENSFENPEIFREEVLAALKKCADPGCTADEFKDKFPEEFKLVQKWTDQESPKLDQDIEVSGWILFNLKRAELYFESGFKDGGQEMLEDIENQLISHSGTILEEIIDRVKEIKQKYLQ